MFPKLLIQAEKPSADFPANSRKNTLGAKMYFEIPQEDRCTKLIWDTSRISFSSRYFQASSGKKRYDIAFLLKDFYFRFIFEYFGQKRRF